MRFPRLLTAILALLALTACGRPAPADISAEIGAVDGKLMAAFARHDGAALAAFYTEDAQLAPPNSDFVTGRDEIAGYWQGAFAAGAGRLELATLEARSSGDSAWEVGRYELADPAGNSLDKGKYVVLWRRVGGAWYLYRDIWNTSRPARRAEPALPAAVTTPAP